MRASAQVAVWTVTLLLSVAVAAQQSPAGLRIVVIAATTLGPSARRWPAAPLPPTKCWAAARATAARGRILPLRAPHATTVWDYINRAMPLNREGTLI